MSKREYPAALVGLVLGALILVVSYGATWAVAQVPVFTGASGDSDPLSEVVLTGRDLAPLGGAAGWVALAGVGGLLATRGWGRRVIGVLLVLAGGEAGVTALTFGLARTAYVDEALDARATVDVTATSLTTSSWWVLAVVGGLLVLVVGILAVVRGHRWPGLSGRYERRAEIPSADGPVSSIAAWDALDRGEDPTDPEAGPGSMGDTRRGGLHE